MNAYLIEFIIILVTFFSYLIYIVNKYGVLSSISKSYYMLPTQSKFLFTLFCSGFAFPAMLLGDSTLMTIAGAGIALVGAGAAFEEKVVKYVHYFGAFGGILAGQLSIMFDMHLWFLSAIFFAVLGILTIFRKSLNNQYLWWVEIDAFATIVLGLGIDKVF